MKTNGQRADSVHAVEDAQNHEKEFPSKKGPDTRDD
jgi:hypothetical protein